MFGRTPDVKGNGRGHYPKAWSSLLCGAGLKTGRAIGRTDARGGAAEDRPVTISDFLATVCKAIKIDHTKEFDTRSGRPMRVVAKGEKSSVNCSEPIWSDTEDKSIALLGLR